MSSEKQHTPGPWAHAGRKGGWDGVDAADGTPICNLEYNNPANATLIAAAPDLLAIAMNILDRGYVSEFIEEERDDHLALAAAVRRATGEGR
jgi:hypothetical protein